MLLQYLYQPSCSRLPAMNEGMKEWTSFTGCDYGDQRCRNDRFGNHAIHRSPDVAAQKQPSWSGTYARRAVIYSRLFSLGPTYHIHGTSPSQSGGLHLTKLTTSSIWPSLLLLLLLSPFSSSSFTINTTVFESRKFMRAFAAIRVQSFLRTMKVGN